MGVKVGETLVANNRPVVKRPVYWKPRSQTDHVCNNRPVVKRPVYWKLPPNQPTENLHWMRPRLPPPSRPPWHRWFPLWAHYHRSLCQTLVVFYFLEDDTQGPVCFTSRQVSNRLPHKSLFTSPSLMNRRLSSGRHSQVLSVYVGQVRELLQMLLLTASTTSEGLRQGSHVVLVQGSLSSLISW
jgi:hypothetical protein